MDKNAYTLRLAEIIPSDWRKSLLANAETAGRFHALPGDNVDIAWRALQKAEEMADKFFKVGA